MSTLPQDLFEVVPKEMILEAAPLNDDEIKLIVDATNQEMARQAAERGEAQ